MVTIICIILTAFIVIFAYRQGLRDSNAKGKNIQIRPSIKPIFTSRAVKLQQSADTLAENFKNYNGTGEGQVKL